MVVEFYMFVMYDIKNLWWWLLCVFLLLDFVFIEYLFIKCVWKGRLYFVDVFLFFLVEFNGCFFLVGFWED